MKNYRIKNKDDNDVANKPEVRGGGVELQKDNAVVETSKSVYIKDYGGGTAFYKGAATIWPTEKQPGRGRAWNSYIIGWIKLRFDIAEGRGIGWVIKLCPSFYRRKWEVWSRKRDIQEGGGGVAD